MLTITKIKTPVWKTPDHTVLNVTIVTVEEGAVPFTTAQGATGDLEAEIWAKALNGDYGQIAEYVAPPELTPEEKRAAMPNLTARQLRLGLLSLGKLNGVPTAISALPSPDKEQAEIEWQYASEFRRLHPLIVQLIPILSLTDEQVDTVWLEYSQV